MGGLGRLPCGEEEKKKIRSLVGAQEKEVVVVEG